MKMKYDESDNAFIRASRAVTDKMTDIIGEAAVVECSGNSHRCCRCFGIQKCYMYPFLCLKDLICIRGP